MSNEFILLANRQIAAYNRNDNERIGLHGPSF